jgi:4-amino-4-deoxy-L-arabinose transferase-like glycosyltransferase
VAALLVIAFGIRLTYVESTSYRALNDAGTYNRMASNVATYGDYRTGTGPRSGAGGSRGPTAYFPPGFPYALAVVDLIDGHQAGGRPAVQPERVAQAVFGTVTVGLIGLVALEAFGPATALVALALATVYPVFVELSGTLVAENLLLVFELAAVWMMLRARRARHPYLWLAGTGVLTGLATLTHENAVLFVIPFGIAGWSVAKARAGPDRSRPRVRSLAAPAILVLFTCLAISPWTIRNAVELHHFVPVSDETGITLAGTYNPVSAGFGPVPYKWRLFSHVPEWHHLTHTSSRYTEVALGNQLQARALDYIGGHPLAPLDAAFHNTLRMFELAGSYAWHASAAAISLPAGVANVGVVSFWILCGLAIAGLFTPVGRAAPRWMWGIPLLYAVSIVPINVETPRFREPIDPFLVLLAACALSAGLRRVRAGRSASLESLARVPAGA